MKVFTAGGNFEISKKDIAVVSENAELTGICVLL
jgi:hypothetical protein